MTAEIPSQIAPFLPEDFTISVKAIFQGELIGKGNFSSVYKGMHLGKYVAIKQQEITDDELERYLLNELAILRFCNHDNIIQYIGAGKPTKQDRRMIFSVTEFIAGGDLSMLLRSKIDIGWSNKATIIWKVADALQYLHKNGIIHRDIKTENIMLALDLNPKLIDLGFARVAEAEDSDRAMTCLGTDEYMAPEVTFAMPYHFPADAFSLGIVIFEVCYGSVPKRTAANGFCVEWEEARNMLKEKETPSSLSQLVEQTASDEATDRLDMMELSEWLEELVGELKSDDKKGFKLDETEVMKRIHNRWAHILKFEGDEEALLKLERNDMETNFLDDTTNDEEMTLRRQSVNRALQMRTPMDRGFENESISKLSEISIPEEIKEVPEATPPTVKERKEKLWKKLSTNTKDSNQEKASLPDIGNFRTVGSRHSRDASHVQRQKKQTSMFGFMSSSYKAKNLKPKKKKNRLFKTNLRMSKKRVQSTLEEDNLLEKADFVYKKLQFGFSSWVKEYLVLSPEGLLYFKDKKGFRKNEVTGALLFMDMVPQTAFNPAIDVSIVQAGKPFCFQVLNKERKIIFQASTKAHKLDWLSKINQGYKAWKRANPTITITDQ